MKPRIHTLPFVVSLTGLALTCADAATFTWARGLAGSFAWNNSTGVTAGESAPSGTVNGNWGGAAGTPGTVPGVNFPGIAGDIANLNNNTSATQTINLDQNVTVGQVVFGNGVSTNTRTLASGGAGSFFLTMNNSAANASISQTSTSIANVTAAVAIGGNGVLALSNNNATGQLNINGGITSALTSGTQTVSKTGAQTVNVNSIIGNGSSGGTVAVDVTAGTLNLTAGNTYTGSTTITAGTLTLGGTAGALSSSSAITNNGTFTINRTNTVVQGTDFGTITSGTGALNATGTGLNLTLNTANTYSGSTTIGAGANNSIVRATASGALGSGNIVLDQTGNASTARLELQGGITLANNILFTARNNTSTGILNVGGNNTLSGAITLGTGGSTYTIESASGLLTVSGNITPPNSSTRTIVITGAGDGELSGNLNFVSGNTLALTKNGAGTWTVSSTGHTYNGATSVSAGKLIVNGNISTSISTTVSGTGTLGGSGAVGNLVAQSGGTVAPGNSIESLGAGNVTFDSGSTYAYELNTLNLNGDLLYSSGTLNVTSGAILTLTELASATRALGDKLTVISYTSGWNNGLFTYLGNTLDDDSLILLGNTTWLFDYNDSSGGSNFTADQAGATGFVTMTVVPEPGAALLGSIGLLALLRRRR